VTAIEELEAAVINLPADKLFQFSQWFEEFMAEQWDKKIEADILAGRLDKIARQVDEDFDAGRVQPL
jgi:hypothetical protein